MPRKSMFNEVLASYAEHIEDAGVHWTSRRVDRKQENLAMGGQIRLGQPHEIIFTGLHRAWRNKDTQDNLTYCKHDEIAPQSIEIVLEKPPQMIIAFDGFDHRELFEKLQSELKQMGVAHTLLSRSPSLSWNALDKRDLDHGYVAVQLQHGNEGVAEFLRSEAVKEYVPDDVIAEFKKAAIQKPVVCRIQDASDFIAVA
ncbi:MAG: hypothetical protein JO089_06100 [Alphaproteobacteria bacterium]|nr:hypothetical protein [Alphaproteobacteria bacterium]